MLAHSSQCPKLTRYFGSYVVGRTLWIVMEYLEVRAFFLKWCGLLLFFTLHRTGSWLIGPCQASLRLDITTHPTRTHRAAPWETSYPWPHRAAWASRSSRTRCGGCVRRWHTCTGSGRSTGTSRYVDKCICVYIHLC